MPSRRAMVPRPLPGIEAWVTRRILLAGLLLALSLPAPQATTAQSAAAARPLPRLRVSDNHRFLVTEKDDPFFWLGDTAWEIFHRLDREGAERYLQNRAKLGFTVVQAVALAEFDGLHTPNAYGVTPLRNDNPDEPDEAYFAHVDWA